MAVLPSTSLPQWLINDPSEEQLWKKEKNKKHEVAFPLSAVDKQQRLRHFINSPQPTRISDSQEAQDQLHISPCQALGCDIEIMPPHEALNRKINIMLPCGALEREIHSLCDADQLDIAMDALLRMDGLCFMPSPNVYMSLLKACKKRKGRLHVRQLQSQLACHGLDRSCVLADYLVVTLARCGCLEEAANIFRRLSSRSVFSWTAIISAHFDCGRVQEVMKLHNDMIEDGVEPDRFTYVCLLKAATSLSDLQAGKRLHQDMQGKSLRTDLFICSTLVAMYGKCGSIEEAENVFSVLPVRDAVLWSTMISAYVEHGDGCKALQSYRQMHEEGMNLDEQVYLAALQACSILAEEEIPIVVDGHPFKAMSLELGQALHTDAEKNEIVIDTYVGSILINMYGLCGDIAKAEYVFAGFSQYDVVLWTAMLSAYAEHGLGDKALQLYRQMMVEGVNPDERAFLMAVQAACCLANNGATGCSTKVVALEIGQELHADVQRKGLSSHICIGSLLMYLYGKCGKVEEAESVFFGLSHQDVISWSSMISVYVEQNQADKAIDLFMQMQMQSVPLDDLTLLSVLQACNQTGSLDICRQVHSTIALAEYDRNLVVANTLIHTYGNCGSMEDAQAVFENITQPDIVSWTVCISGYAQEGNYVACQQMFQDMQVAGIKPDSCTFLTLLSACSHAGLIDKGVEFFESMTVCFSLVPELKHYAGLVDLFGRAGDFVTLECVLEKMPMQLDMATLLCLLGTCSVHCNVKLGKKAFDDATRLQPEHAAAYALMSNIYADAAVKGKDSHYLCQLMKK